VAVNGVVLERDGGTYARYCYFLDGHDVGYFRCPQPFRIPLPVAAVNDTRFVPHLQKTKEIYSDSID
jgi:hypothetical protein